MATGGDGKDDEDEHAPHDAEVVDAVQARDLWGNCAVDEGRRRLCAGGGVAAARVGPRADGRDADEEDRQRQLEPLAHGGVALRQWRHKVQVELDEDADVEAHPDKDPVPGQRRLHVDEAEWDVEEARRVPHGDGEPREVAVHVPVELRLQQPVGVAAQGGPAEETRGVRRRRAAGGGGFFAEAGAGAVDEVPRDVRRRLVRVDEVGAAEGERAVAEGFVLRLVEGVAGDLRGIEGRTRHAVGLRGAAEKDSECEWRRDYQKKQRVGAESDAGWGVALN